MSAQLPICDACGMTHDLVPYCIDRPVPVYPKRGQVAALMDEDDLKALEFVLNRSRAEIQHRPQFLRLCQLRDRLREALG